MSLEDPLKVLAKVSEEPPSEDKKAPWLKAWEQFVAGWEEFLPYAGALWVSDEDNYPEHPQAPERYLREDLGIHFSPKLREIIWDYGLYGRREKSPFEATQMVYFVRALREVMQGSKGKGKGVQTQKYTAYKRWQADSKRAKTYLRRAIHRRARKLATKDGEQDRPWGAGARDYARREGKELPAQVRLNPEALSEEGGIYKREKDEHSQVEEADELGVAGYLWDRRMGLKGLIESSSDSLWIKARRKVGFDVRYRTETVRETTEITTVTELPRDAREISKIKKYYPETVGRGGALSITPGDKPTGGPYHGSETLMVDEAERIVVKPNGVTVYSGTRHRLRGLLSPQQYRVMLLLAQGYSRERVAEELSITLSTLRRHMMDARANVEVQRIGRVVLGALEPRTTGPYISPKDRRI